ncbi:MAG: winged helix-turn-helix transcriptional regulator, partial [Candidatus Atribacteria bacterium]|nr:winged helix-turn-helix transcriptional regulator [Candidatus Atribacteria bacterium]
MRGTPSLIRKINRSNVIGLIQKQGSLSRSEISRISGLSLPSVSRIIDSLIQEGILKEIGKGESLRGKKPFLIDINSEFPLAAIIVPLYKIMGQAGLIDTFASLIIGYLAFSVPVGVWLLRGFFIGIPKELEEAAQIDGCSQLQAFWK